MDLPLDPKLALAKLPFGSSRVEVRAFFGGEPQLFRRSPASRDGYYWAALGVFAYYDNADNLEAIELAAPASPSLTGQVLTSLRLQDAKQVLRQHDHAMEDESDGAISKALGIGIWSEAGMDGLVQAVIRFKGGYYD
jgi:hypothetical protein